MALIVMPLGNDYEDSEFDKPYEAFKNAGHRVTIMGTERGAVVEGKQGRSTARKSMLPQRSFGLRTSMHS